VKDLYARHMSDTTATPESAAAPLASSQPSVTNVYVQQHANALPPRAVGIAYVWWFFLGAVGAHQFYLGKTGRAISYIFTFGWLGIGILIDLFTLPAQTRQVNAQRAVGIG
jgi:TM2 domain-containing membrane protein YozV